MDLSATQELVGARLQGDVGDGPDGIDSRFLERNDTATTVILI